MNTEIHLIESKEMSVTGIFTPDAKKHLTFGKPVSGIYQDFLEPLMVEWVNMDPRPDHSYLNHICSVPWMIWNTVVMADYYPKAKFSASLSDIESMVPGDAIKGATDFWIDRKRKEFGKYRFLFGDCEFYINPRGEPRCRADIRIPDSVTEIYGKYGEKASTLH